MKKFISISFCLMLCLTAVFMFAGCKEKPKPVAQDIAEQKLSVALNKFYDATAIKAVGSGLVDDTIVIMANDYTYHKSTMYGLEEMWTVKEGDYFYKYAIEYGEETSYTKRLVLTEHEELDNELISMIDLIDEMVYASATELNGEITVNYNVEDDDEGIIKLGFVVKNESLKSMTMSIFGIKATFSFEYGESVLNNLPETPTSVPWYIYEPRIVVEGLKDYYQLNEEIDYDELTLKYYADKESSFYEEYDVTSDMISGWTTNEVNSGTIVVTFYGLTFTQEYTCK
ncbi:MAG: hypothetical protein IKY10_00110 [Clostridia bacterium]|nr:hypothetical protein [Clostridia bacterium]